MLGWQLLKVLYGVSCLNCSRGYTEQGVLGWLDERCSLPDEPRMAFDPCPARLNHR